MKINTVDFNLIIKCLNFTNNNIMQYILSLRDKSNKLYKNKEKFNLSLFFINQIFYKSIRLNCYTLEDLY
jgi:hypothetical protein